MNEELKPCPFCGSKAFLWSWNGGTGVQCSNFDSFRHIVQVCAKTREEAIEEWNRRAKDAD